MAKAADSFYFYEISRHTAKRVDELLRERLSMQSPGVSCLYPVSGARERTLCDSAAIQRKDKSNLLERD